MESTAQYWRPVWEALEQRWSPPPAGHAFARRSAQPRSISPKRNRIVALAGARKDCPDAGRLVKRSVAGELTLSFVPDVEQRL